jgi:hypothetical protein
LGCERPGLEHVERYFRDRLQRRGVDDDEQIDVGGGHVQELSVRAQTHGARVGAAENIDVVDRQAPRDGDELL